MVIILGCIISCNKSSDLSKDLTGDNMRFWNIYDSAKHYITGSYSFNKNGECIYYNYKKGKRAKIFDGDVVYPHTWKLENDNILNIQGFKRKILKFASDTLFLQNINLGDSIFLIKSES